MDRFDVHAQAAADEASKALRHRKKGEGLKKKKKKTKMKAEQ